MNENVAFSLEESVRYSRQMKLEEIGLQGQARLKQARIAVVGAGGLGCPVLMNLTAAGVGYIRIIDNDVVSLSNISRQMLYVVNDVGRKKVLAAKERLIAMNSNVHIDAIDLRVDAEHGADLLSEVDIVVDGSDNFATRYIVDRICSEKNIPLVAGSIFQFEGQLSVFHYQGSPGLKALYPHPPQASERPACGEIGVLGVVPNIVGNLQANEVLKIVLDMKNVLAGKLLVFNALSMQFTQIDYSDLKDDCSMNIEEPTCQEKTVGQLIEFEKVKEDTSLYLIDVRTKAEHHQFNLGGVCVPLQELRERIGEVPCDKNVLLYCKSGMRSNLAAQLLHSVRTSDKIFQLHGGMEAVPVDSWQLRS